MALPKLSYQSYQNIGPLGLEKLNQRNKKSADIDNGGLRGYYAPQKWKIVGKCCKTLLLLLPFSSPSLFFFSFLFLLFLLIFLQMIGGQPHLPPVVPLLITPPPLMFSCQNKTQQNYDPQYIWDPPLPKKMPTPLLASLMLRLWFDKCLFWHL